MRLLVNIDVDDLARGIAFYAAGLGLRLERLLFDGSVAEMLGAPSPIYLLSKPSGSAPVPGYRAVRDYQRHWTPVHLDFEVADAALAVDRAVRAGATLESELESYRWGQLARLCDPFGHGFCLLQMADGGYARAG